MSLKQTTADTPTPEELDLLFHALSDRTRRDMLDRLARQSETIGALADSYAMSLAAVSKHVRVLEKAGFVSTTKEGRVHRCTLNPEPLDQVTAEVARYKRFWEARLAALDDFVQTLTAQSTPKEP